MIKKQVKDVAKLNQATLDSSNAASITYLDTSSITRNIVEQLQFLDPSKDKIPSRAKRLVKDNTIVYSVVRPNLEHHGIIKNPCKRMVVSTGFATLDVIDEKTINPEYLYYHLSQKHYTSFLSTIAENNTSSYPAINPSDLEDLKIELIEDVKAQSRIANILSALDAKIAISTKINADLERLAKLVYDYWFVQFDFPGENGLPYKTSGGRLVYSPILKRKIPFGWGTATFKDWIAEDKGGDWGEEVSTGKHTYKVTCIRGADFPSLFQCIVPYAPVRYILENNKSETLSDGDLIIEISGGSPTQSTGRICYINKGTLKRFNTAVITSNFCKAISPKKINLSYIFYLEWQRLYSAGAFFNYEGKTTGLKNFLFDIFTNSHKIVSLPDNLAEKFHNTVSPLFEAIQHNALEAQELTKLRDWLLPMLMNGQVKIK